jgi:hypothetical protein
MKKLFFVFGTDSKEETEFLRNISELHRYRPKWTTLFNSHESYSALNETIKAISDYGSPDQSENIVIFAGDNLYRLAEGLPCNSINMTEFLNGVNNSTHVLNEGFRQQLKENIFAGVVKNILQTELQEYLSE